MSPAALPYLDSQNDQFRKTSGENSIVPLSARARARAQAEPVRVNYTRPTGVYSYGIDPMVSYASVIHELAYGRISANTPAAQGGTEYPIPGDHGAHNLDIFV